MSMRRGAPLVTAILLAATVGFAEDIPATPKPTRMAVYYFGNSLTGSTIPELHPQLGKSKGKEWVWDIMAVGGGMLWQFRDQFELDAKLGPLDEHTLDPDLFKMAPYAAQKFLSGKWDAVLLQPYCTKMSIVQKEMWNKKFDTDRDFGDLAATKYLIDLTLKNNPACTIYIYQDWPGLWLIEGSFGLAAEGVVQTGKELNAGQMLPIARSFDYPREWLRYDDQSQSSWLSGAQSRMYKSKLFGELIKAYPKLWEEGRLRMIPVGDIYLALDRKMRAGLVPGVLNLGEFYTDIEHHRAGMPAYTGAAAFYTMLFGEKPHGLDYTLYNNQDNFGKDRGRGKDENNDSGIPLEITPERAAVINDTVWEVIQAHPFTRFSPGGSVATLASLEAAIPAPIPVRVLEYGYQPGWSAMPCWQGALDRSAGKATAWTPVLQREDYAQRGGCEFLARVFREKKHPYPFRQYFMEMEEPYFDPPLRHQGLCLQPAGGTDKETAAFVFLADHFLEKRSGGFLLGYFPWPEIPEAAAFKAEQKLKKWQLIPEERMAAMRKGFDYSAAWNAPGESASTSAGMNAFVEKLRVARPNLAAKFRPIPAGALLAALDAQLKADALPGVGGVGEFYKDELTLRTGLPRYAIAALRFAVVHQTHPKALDAAFFNEPKSYYPDAFDPANKRGQGKDYVVVRDEEFDNGPHFPITPAGKKLVDDAVWKLVGNKP
jgi:hypothetical protein